MAKLPPKPAREGAEHLAIQALSFMAADPERLGAFLATTGLGPDEIREAAQDPHFLAGVLDYLCGQEHLLIEFAERTQIDPMEIGRAQAALGNAPPGREAP